MVAQDVNENIRGLKYVATPLSSLPIPRMFPIISLIINPKKLAVLIQLWHQDSSYSGGARASVVGAQRSHPSDNLYKTDQITVSRLYAPDRARSNAPHMEDAGKLGYPIIMR